MNQRLFRLPALIQSAQNRSRFHQIWSRADNMKNVH
jgi:hypothetical protein